MIRHIILPGIFLWLLVTVSCLSAFDTTSTEYLKARQALETRDEVAFICYVNTPSDLIWLTDLVSIDNVINGTTVYAYANTREFKAFLTKNIPYSVLTRPALNEQPGAAPSVRSLTTDWASYPKYDTYLSTMEQFQTTYPELCTIKQFGTSVNGRKLLAAKVTSGVCTTKPRFFYQSTIHGDELCGLVMMMRLIEYLCSKYGSDARVTTLVDSIEIWINPLINPDGTYFGGDTTVALARRYNAHSIDLNRNYPDLGAISRALLEPETQATIDLCNTYPMVMAADIHSGIELCCYVWGCWANAHADDTWWKYVGREFADTAQKNGPIGFFDDLTGCINGYDWYPAIGERMNYAAYKQQCRSLTIEIATNKLLAPSELDNHWNYLYPSFLNYLEQVRFGIRGTVTDSITGASLEAKIFIVNHDIDSSHVYSHLPSGDYYRPVAEGTYTIVFSCDGYQDKMIKNIPVHNKKATIVDVQLSKDPNGIRPTFSRTTYKDISITHINNGIQIQAYGTTTQKIMTAAVYTLSGTLVKTLQASDNTLFWNGTTSAGNRIGKGCYFLRILVGDHVIHKNFLF